MASSTALPASTCLRFLRVAISIILGERSIAVIVPVVSLSQTSETATPWPQPTSSRRSAGPTSRVSTAQTNRSDALPATPQQYHHAPVKPMLICSMSVSASSLLLPRATSETDNEPHAGGTSLVVLRDASVAWLRGLESRSGHAHSRRRCGQEGSTARGRG